MRPGHDSASEMREGLPGHPKPSSRPWSPLVAAGWQRSARRSLSLVTVFKLLAWCALLGPLLARGGLGAAQASEVSLQAEAQGKLYKEESRIGGSC